MSDKFDVGGHPSGLAAAYTAAKADKEYAHSLYSGTFIVNGDNVNQGITFSLVTYTVTFTETGLLSGTTWYVNITNGQYFSSTTNTIYNKNNIIHRQNVQIIVFM